MNYLSCILILVNMNPEPIFNFNRSANIDGWRIVNDVVMGGRSSSNFDVTAEGHGRFSGTVSLENNGGFCSVRYDFPPIPVRKENHLVFKIKGDGKDYQMRIKDKTGRYYSYIKTFQTSGQWETVKITLNEMYPSFRGRILDGPNFNHDQIEEIVILIGNKKPEQFELLIDRIGLE
jgi:NADH dehydrogenase [ubiquinone] 1 alpha subcomplex assembly factor 1